LQKLIKNFPQSLKNEILDLWEEFSAKKTKEAGFVDQINCLATFLQALQYWQKDKNFPIKSFGEGVLEFISDPSLLTLLKSIENKFLKK